MEAKQRIACIVGPTACGKTALSIRVAQLLCAEIVSADSVQVYRGLDIGSAKPTMEEQQGVPHHLIDCIDIDRAGFSVSEYREMAIRAIQDIAARGKLPLVVGGSGLYVNALTYPLNFAIPSDPAVREQLEVLFPPEAMQRAWDALHAIDAQTAARLHPNDRKRIIRALEVHACSGRPLSAFGNDFANSAGADTPFDPMMIGLTMDRELLYQRIDARVDAMLEQGQGLLEEARRIAALGLSRRLPAMQSIGYRQLFAYFDGDCTYETAIEEIKRETRRFAKRQIAWFKRDERIRWFNVSEEPLECLAETIVREIRSWISKGEIHEDQ